MRTTEVEEKTAREILDLLKKQGYVGPRSGEPVLMDLEIEGWCAAKNNESSIHVSVPNKSAILLRENSVPPDVFTKVCKEYDYQISLRGRQIGESVSRLEELPSLVKRLIDTDRLLYEKSPAD